MREDAAREGRGGGREHGWERDRPYLRGFVLGEGGRKAKHEGGLEMDRRAKMETEVVVDCDVVICGWRDGERRLTL